MVRKLLLLFSHAAFLAIGFALGIYFLPILSAPEAPSASEVSRGSTGALFSGQFRRDLQDSDFLHWGEGEVYVHADRVAHLGELAPGPDYRLYFSPEWVETEAAFLSSKDRMVEVGHVNTFNNFMLPLPHGFDPRHYNTVVVWCESFSQFITAAQYR